MTHQEIGERDIVDAYLRGELAENDRQAFEEHFFTCDECFAQVQAAEKFGAGVREAVASGRFPSADVEQARGGFAAWLRPAFAFSSAAAVLLAGVTGWLMLVELPRLRQDADSERRLAAGERSQRAALERQMAVNRLPSAEANLPLVMLEASRAASANSVAVPAEAKSLALWIEAGPAWRHSLYRLEIRTSGDQPVESVDGLVKNSYGALAASVPAARLMPGRYRARVFGVEGTRAELLGEYPIEVKR